MYDPFIFYVCPKRRVITFLIFFIEVTFQNANAWLGGVVRAHLIYQDSSFGYILLKKYCFGIEENTILNVDLHRLLTPRNCGRVVMN